MADLVVESLDLARLDNARVVAQPVVHLWTIGLGVDRLQLDALDVLVLFGSLRRRVNIDAFLPLPDAGKRPEGPEVAQRMGIGIRLGENILGELFHADFS